MHPVTKSAFVDEFQKISAARFKGNDRMPSATKTNVSALEADIHNWNSPHQKDALAFVAKTTPTGAFELLHGMRRWYAGQTMAHNVIKHRDSLRAVMKLEPKDVVGVFRGFKVDADSDLAKLQVGDRIALPVTRNRGLSSWSTTEAPTNKFSGKSKGKVGLIVKLVDSEGATPLLAPPEHTQDWFNALYTHVIGKSHRPVEGEYLIQGPKLNVEVVRVKK